MPILTHFVVIRRFGTVICFFITTIGDSCDDSFDSYDDNDAENYSSVSRKVINDSPSTMALPSDITVQHDHISTEISSVVRELGEEQEKSNGDGHENVTVIEQKSDDADKFVQSQKLWSRSKLRNAVRLHDIDIVPKVMLMLLLSTRVLTINY